jgi:hypothetical protein
LGQSRASLDCAAFVNQGQGPAGDRRSVRVVGGGREFRLRETCLVVAERGTLRQSSGDQGCCPVGVTEGQEDDRGTRGGPAREEVQVFAHGERVLEGAQRLVEVARRLRAIPQLDARLLASV